GDRADVDGRRQEVHDRVEQGLHALVLERGATQNGVELGGKRRTTNRGVEDLDGDLLATEEQLGEVVVDVSEGLEEGLATLFGGVGEIGGDLLDLVVLAHGGLAAPREGAHADEVDDAHEVTLGSDGELQ